MTSRLTDRRSVYPADEIPHLWAHGVPAGREIRNQCRNLFAQGDTIFSYGQHFPMARRVETPGGIVFLVTTRTYSVTTSRHLSRTRYAVPLGALVFNIDPFADGKQGCGSSPAPLWVSLCRRVGGPVADWYQSKIDGWIDRAARPRIRAHTRERAIVQAEVLREEWVRIHETFRLRCAVDRVKVPASIDEVRERNAAALKRERAAEARREAERAAREAERAAIVEQYRPAMIDEWRATGRVAPREDDRLGSLSIADVVGYPILRVDGAYVRSSLGACVDVDAVRGFLRDSLPRLVSAARANPERRAGDPGAMVGDYRGVSVTRDGVAIGCHAFPWREVRAFAEHVGIPVDVSGVGD